MLELVVPNRVWETRLRALEGLQSKAKPSITSRRLARNNEFWWLSKSHTHFIGIRALSFTGTITYFHIYECPLPITEYAEISSAEWRASVNGMEKGLSSDDEDQ